jgi:hypothetical protein
VLFAEFEQDFREAVVGPGVPEITEFLLHLRQPLGEKPDEIFRYGGDGGQQLHQASLREDGDHGIRRGDGGEEPHLLGEEEFPEDRALLEDVHDRFRPFVGEGENPHRSVLDDVESVGRVALGEDRGALRVPPLGAKLFDPLRLGFGNSLEQLDGRGNG